MKIHLENPSAYGVEHYEDILSSLSKCHCEIVVIAEAGLSSLFAKIEECQTTNYNVIYSSGKLINANNVVIFIRKDIPYSDLHIDEEDSVILLKMKVENRAILFGALYASHTKYRNKGPYISLLNKLTSMIQNNPADKIIITGDFNCPMLYQDGKAYGGFAKTITSKSDAMVNFQMETRLLQVKKYCLKLCIHII